MVLLGVEGRTRRLNGGAVKRECVRELALFQLGWGIWKGRWDVRESNQEKDDGGEDGFRHFYSKVRAGEIGLEVFGDGLSEAHAPKRGKRTCVYTSPHLPAKTTTPHLPIPSSKTYVKYQINTRRAHMSGNNHPLPSLTPDYDISPRLRIGKTYIKVNYPHLGKGCLA